MLKQQVERDYESLLVGRPMLERIEILESREMRIGVRVVSILPDELAREIEGRNIYILSRDLREIGFKDILVYSWNEDEINRERIERAREFLKDSFLTFYVRVMRNDRGIRFFNAKNVQKHVLPAAMKLSDISFTPIPVLNIGLTPQTVGKVFFNRLPSKEMDSYRFPEYPPYFVAYRDYFFGCNSGWEGTWFGSWTIYPPDGEEVKVVAKEAVSEERIIYRTDCRLMFMTNQDVSLVAMEMENSPALSSEEFAGMFAERSAAVGAALADGRASSEPPVQNSAAAEQKESESVTGQAEAPDPVVRESPDGGAEFDGTSAEVGPVSLGRVQEPLQSGNIEERSENDGEGENKYTTEEQFLDHLEKLALSSQLVYDRDDLVNFHTAVKTGSLVILAGMSGVGKSQLVVNYAKALDLAGAGDLSQENPQFLFIPIRPNWNDDSDLIGYYDAVHKVYRPSETGLVDLLIEAEKNDNEYRSGKSEYKLYLICFDEMNLARVEHYFSQFLSILELNEPRYLTLYSEKLAPEVYNRHEYKPKIRIGSNVHFIGTVNVDESSYPFSDKVLDRANVIRLKVNESLREWNQKLSEHVDLNRRGKERDGKGVNNLTISGSTFASWCIPDSGRTGFTLEELDFLDALNRELRQIDKEKVVGYRVLRQIASYLRNIPQRSDGSPMLDRREAFDLQVVQRILTKIKGPETDLGEVFGKYTKLDQAKGKMVEIMNEHSKVSDFQHSRDICYRKAKELVDHGYAS